MDGARVQPIHRIEVLRTDLIFVDNDLIPRRLSEGENNAHQQAPDSSLNKHPRNRVTLMMFGPTPASSQLDREIGCHRYRE